MADRTSSTPLNRIGIPSSIVDPTAVQFGSNCPSVILGNDLMRLTEQSGRFRMICSAEIVRTSGVNSMLRFRTELRNSSTSENLKICGASNGAPELFFIEFQSLEFQDLEFQNLEFQSLEFQNLRISELANFRTAQMSPSTAVIR